MEDEDLIWGNVENPDPYDLLFDEDKARKAASAVKIFQDVSVGSTKEKMKEEGTQQRETIGKSGQEQRETAAQAQRFSQEDEVPWSIRCQMTIFWRVF